MASQNSRYRRTPILTYVAPDGTPTRYLARRFLPRAEDLGRTGRITVKVADRIDTIAARALADPLQYWRICDAQPATPDPFDVVGDNDVLLVKVPTAEDPT